MSLPHRLRVCCLLPWCPLSPCEPDWGLRLVV